MMKLGEFVIVSGIILLILLSGCIEIAAESGGDSLSGLYAITSNLLCLLLLITPAIVAILILYAGFQYLASADDSAKRAEAKNMIFNAILGLIIIVGIAYTAAWIAPKIDLTLCY
jgi:heme/copper-type cytochrome/quinol oxidase subunit 2